jgi:hypothetical protein
MNTKPAITITTTILVSVLASGLALAQSPSVIQNTRGTMNAVSNHSAAASNEALGVNESAPTRANAIHLSPTPSAQKSAPPVAVSAFSVKKPAPAKHVGPRRHAGGVVVVSGVSVNPNVKTPAPGGADIAPASTGEVAGGETTTEQPVVPDGKYAANGRRDPFISPVVSRAGGSGCSTGKKCLEIGAINLRGVVHSENGFIAVVSNGLNKAYFLRENDPVFNGYVVKITGDSIVFQETLQDRLGKSFTREVVKKITTPAV